MGASATYFMNPGSTTTSVTGASGLETLRSQEFLHSSQTTIKLNESRELSFVSKEEWTSNKELARVSRKRSAKCCVQKACKSTQQSRAVSASVTLPSIPGTTTTLVKTALGYGGQSAEMDLDF